MNRPEALCPLLQEQPDINHPRRFAEALASAPLIELGQPWRPEPEPAFRPAQVRCAWTPQALLVHADLWDDEIFSRANGPNQRTWELGDVFEMFFQPDCKASYFELHVTPSNWRAQFFFPEAGAAMRPLDDGFFASLTEVSHATGRWEVMACIPAILFSPSCTLRAGTETGFSFCRYDATRGGGLPTLSSSSPHPVPKFHRPAEWGRLRFGLAESLKIGWQAAPI